MARIDDLELIRRDYSEPERLAMRFRPFRQWHEGAAPEERIIDAVAQGPYERVLEIGCGEGGFSALLRERLGIAPVAVDMSPAMVERARARGVDARVGDAQDLPFPDCSFDTVVANWMLYHVPDLDRALSEVVRVLDTGGRFVAATMGPGMLHEIWDLVPDDGSAPDLGFSSTNGHSVLSSWFRSVERVDLRGTAVFPDRQAVVDYMRATLTRAHLAEHLPHFEGPLRATTTNTVFVAREPVAQPHAHAC